MARKTNITVVLLLGVSVLACPLIMRINPGDPPDFSESRRVYRWQRGGWTALPGLPGGTDELKITQGGTVWTTVPSSKSIQRWDGAKWVGTGADREVRATGGFALQGEEVWASTREGVARFDGRTWRLYPEAVKTRRAVATAAGPSGVWVIDSEANLSHWDGTAWSIQNLKSTIADWDSRVEYDRPELRVTADGAVWLLLEALWRMDDAGWHEIRRDDVDFYNAVLIGQDAGSVWLKGRSHIFEMKAVGAVGRTFDVRSLPIEKGAAIFRLAVSDGKVWLATTKDLLIFDGNEWRRCGIPPETTLLKEIAVGPDGSGWVVGEQRSLLKIAMWVAPPLAGCAVALLAIGGLLVMWAKSQAEERLAADQVVAQAAGGAAEIDLAARRAQVKKHGYSLFWKVPLFLIGFPYLMMTIAWGERYLRSQWPGAPEWMLWACVLSPIVVLGGIWIAMRLRKPAQSGRMFGGELRVVLLAAVFIFLLNRLPVMGTLWSWTQRIVPIPALAAPVLIFVFILVFTLIAQSRSMLAVALTRKLWLAGEYDRALRRLRWLSFMSPTPAMLQVEGIIHSLAGRSAEAESCYRKAIANARGASPNFRRALLCGLGFTLGDLGRFEESQRCLETVIALGDKNGSARVGIAENLLRQGSEPEKALALIEEAQGMTKSRLADAERWGTKAWALALLGRQPEMESAMATALRSVDPALPVVAASMHWRLGRALVAVQRVPEALDHFRKACQVDPNGHSGLISQMELQRYQA